MRLTWRDGATTLLLGAVVVIAFATTQAWDWPLLGSYRSASIVLFGVGMAMCILGGSAESMTGAGRSASAMLATTLGVLALALFIVTLITGSEAWFVALAVDIAVLWAVSTLRHVFLSHRPITGPVPAS